MNQVASTFETQIVKTIRLHYLMHLPRDYEDKSKEP